MSFANVSFANGENLSSICGRACPRSVHVLSCTRGVRTMAHEAGDVSSTMGWDDMAVRC